MYKSLFFKKAVAFLSLLTSTELEFQGRGEIQLLGDL